MHIYGYTPVIDDEQWTFGIGFKFTVDEATGSVNWDFSKEQSVSLDVSIGGRSEEGPPESINSVMNGRAHKIEKVDISPPSPPKGLRTLND